MTDCPNAEMRDRLPDLLHEGLDVSARAVVVAHVAECPDCSAELALLREARIVLSAAVRPLDVNAVARIVADRSRLPVAIAPRGARWRDWRIAASIVVLAVGGAAFVRLHHWQDTRVAMHVAASHNPELSAAGGVSDLSESDLRALVDDLPTLDALPSTDPDPVTMRVTPPGTESVE